MFSLKVLEARVLRTKRGAGKRELSASLVELLPSVGGLGLPVGDPGCKFSLEAIKLFLEGGRVLSGLGQLY